MDQKDERPEKVEPAKPRGDVRQALRRCRIESRARAKTLQAQIKHLEVKINTYEDIIAEFSKAIRRPRQDSWKVLTPRVRFAVMLRDNFRCTYCGVDVKQGAKLEIDHIVPISAGGKTIATNLRTACSLCNAGKSNTLLDLEAMAQSVPRHPSAVSEEGREAGSGLRSGIAGPPFGVSMGEPLPKNGAKERTNG